MILDAKFRASVDGDVDDEVTSITILSLVLLLEPINSAELQDLHLKPLRTDFVNRHPLPKTGTLEVSVSKL